ncbi:chemotaxis protein CheA [Sulfitobacter pseudonitzschiae]|uniref:Chemotaxis protein CheA n=2 Tax=Pseudosulfitobacter pseudonitzschiae TaxID=1402135 RepID=A0A9Q2RR13_9RHOB|nr:chemotaxis protein CheA [Pseudosulfitobacter pseudonitzschiae]MBM2295822.1 chemotaxis protein CheA [Pseudosulfitobacter pseudonitzschiae]MBM2300735.1 chemotaxis protein CheA [Pseudosulfitobacter pseudonitzschiae]MBM2310519.1 chemotaxis protein CheA [Pseudosulfitobacter pseudonitzschiae]MBM2315432.1 chemotaxis protein CheA [Pseudosulfitobacter pseudonitzschiae]|tara:strand:+ start:3551 stop:5656 length:2106 start_codon:yes stop_codon:yes gene_type:complete
MAEIRASFFIECEELLEALQDGLEAMAEDTGDLETINVVFRAVHSIKGGAGAFGLEGLVRFAHRYETVLDAVRSNTLVADGDAIKLFFRAADHLSDLVRESRDDGILPEAEGDAILTELDALLGDHGVEEEDEAEIEFQPLGLSLDLGLADLPPPAPARFTINFAPEPEMYETGNEPYMILRALAELGSCEVTCLTDKIPQLNEFAPEASYLKWTVVLTADVQEAEIVSIFEFVDGLCALTIAPIQSDVPATQEVSNDPLPDLPVLPELTPPPARAADPVPPQTPAPAAKAKATPQSAAKSVVRVDLDRIERLVNLVGELVINQAMLSQSLESSGLSPHSDAMNGLEEFQRLTRDIQDSVMMIRAQPVKSLFQRMSRIVRECSAAVRKDVRLVTEGDTTEVDKTVIERLSDPLTHMIRNAVDHGLESTQNRLAAGKPEQGVVKLTAAHRSGRVIIEVSDDGGGINREKVKQIATEKGLIAADASLTDTEIDNLLFLPGFSTASEVSDLSGRGVGMDVVRNAIQALGGRITITSTPGEGTTFSISLPLTLAVLDGMVVQVAGETMVLPLNLVIETLTIDHSNLEQTRPGLNVVRVRGEFVSLFDLGVELGYRSAQDSYLDAVVLLIADEAGSRAALIVDEIQDQRQVVIKGLDESFYRAPGIAAATILGDGQIALILDPSDIIAQAQGSTLAIAPNLMELTS